MVIPGIRFFKEGGGGGVGGSERIGRWEAIGIRRSTLTHSKQPGFLEAIPEIGCRGMTWWRMKKESGPGLCSKGTVCALRKAEIQDLRVWAGVR